MPYTFNLLNDWYGTSGFKLYNRVNNITLNEGLTVLVGCNGSGKTTFVKQLKASLKKNKISTIEFDNRHDGDTKHLDRFAMKGDFATVANLVISSEGENIYSNIGRVLVSIRTRIGSLESGSNLFILLDAVDSGFSIDNIIELKNIFYDLVLKDSEKHSIHTYIIIVTNSYEFANGEKCFDVVGGKYITFKDYEDYKKFILKSREKKNKRDERYINYEESYKKEDSDTGPIEWKN